MSLRETLDKFGDFLDGEEMTGRQAGLIMVFWMGFTALFGIVVFIITFVILGF